MINNSRLSNGMRAAGLMRRAVTEAVYFSQQRRAFGQRLINMPLMRRQLAKMTVWAEQARSVMFQTAQALAEADQGRADPALARILTPLIKFRACRDARKVTGDAMEARRLRLHRGMDRAAPGARRTPGLDLEGTSNIVALDVLRAINRENSLPALRRHVDQLLAEGVPCTDALAATQQDAIERSFAFAAMAAEGNRAELARQAATLLYHAVSIAALRRKPASPAWKRARCWPTWCCGIAWPRATRIRRPRTKAPTAPPSCNTRCSTARHDAGGTAGAPPMETTMKRLLIPLLLATATLTAAAPASAADAYPRVPSRWSCPSARRPDRRDGAPPGRKLRQPLNQTSSSRTAPAPAATSARNMWRTPSPTATPSCSAPPARWRSTSACTRTRAMTPRKLRACHPHRPPAQHPGGPSLGAATNVQALIAYAKQHRTSSATPRRATARLAPGRHPVQPDGRHADHAYPVQGHRPRAERPARRPGIHVLHRHPDRAAPSRPASCAPSAWPARSARTRCPTCPPFRNRG